MGTNNYKFDASSALHTGENKFRVKQTGFSGRTSCSRPVAFDPGIPIIDCWPRKVKDTLHFSKISQYEIFDAYGNKVMQGKAIKVICSNLKKGAYYLNLDNRTDKFIKTRN